MGDKITIERLKDILDYNPETGIFLWLKYGGQKKIGDKAGSKRDDGYVIIQIDGKGYYAHHLAWFFVYGEWRKLDHKDLIKSNNKIDNLRPATTQQNAFNQGEKRKNKMGIKGITIDKRTGKWIAYIKINNKSKYLGSYITPEEAGEAYRKMAEKYHGEFMRVA